MALSQMMMVIDPTWRVPEALTKLISNYWQPMDASSMMNGSPMAAKRFRATNIDGPYVEEVEVVEPEPDPRALKIMEEMARVPRRICRKVGPAWARAFIGFGLILRRRRRAESEAGSGCLFLPSTR